MQDHQAAMATYNVSKELFDNWWAGLSADHKYGLQLYNSLTRSRFGRHTTKLVSTPPGISK